MANNNDNLDLRILSILVVSKKDLENFSITVGENVFEPHYRRFVKHLIGYYGLYSSCPTISTLIEYAASNNSNLADYLTQIWDNLNPNVDIREYGFVLNKLNKRYNINLLIHTKEKLNQENITEDNVDSINITLNQISSEIGNIGAVKSYEEVSLRNCVEDWKQQFFAKAKNIEIAQGVMTGFSMFDYYTNGMKPGLYVVAAQSGHGKSIFLLNVAVNCLLGKNVIPETFEELVAIKETNAWKKSYNVLYFSLEMPKDEVLDRVISNIASVDSLDLGKGTIRQDQALNIKKSLYYFENAPTTIKIIDMPRGCSMSQIQQIYDNVKNEMDIDLVVIDYLGLMVDSKGDADQDWQKLMVVSEEMHEFTRVNKVPVLTALQLAIVKAGSQSPGMERIGRSRGILANVNLALQIEDREDEDLKTDSIIHCIKHRGGPKFIMNNLRKEFQYTRFADLGFNTKNLSTTAGSNMIPQQDLSAILKDIFGEEEITF